MLGSRTLATLAASLTLGLTACGGGTGGAPDVKGLPLPDAKRQLKQAGYSSAVTSDATFGVVVEQNFTVCDQDKPKGKLVPLKVSKQC